MRRMAVTGETEPACNCFKVRDDELRAWFSPRRAAYVTRVLTAEELAVVADPADALVIARIKRMPDHKLARFERSEPTTAEDRRLYHALQVRWLADEQYLLGTRLGRAPTHREFFADFMRNHNGLRFRAYFAIKHRHRVRPTPAAPRCTPTPQTRSEYRACDELGSGAGRPPGP